MLRDERRRQLRTAADVFDCSGQRGRCPPFTVNRPSLSALAPDPGQAELRKENA